MRAVIRVVVEVDVDAYRAEYGEPDATASEARDYVAALVEQGAQIALRPFDYATVEVTR